MSSGVFVSSGLTGVFVSSGPYCDVCQEGFYGDPTGFSGLRRPCRPCSCNGHIDVRITESCDRRTGECLKCLNNTRGQTCESCLTGFYHSRPTDACKCESKVVVLQNTGGLKGLGGWSLEYRWRYLGGWGLDYK